MPVFSNTDYWNLPSYVSCHLVYTHFYPQLTLTY